MIKQASILTGVPLTSVVHCTRNKYDIYIGRPSKWGNPFKIGIDGSRQEVISMYKVWILEQPKLMNSINELRGKILGCWCKPGECGLFSNAC